jgi:hypothetical protein
MKSTLTTSVTFDASEKSLNFSAVTGFDVRRLYAVINMDDGIVIYATGTSGKGYVNVASNVVTLQYDTTGMGDADTLQIIYDDVTALPVSISTPTATTVKQAAVTVGTTAVRATHDGSAPSGTRRQLVIMPDPASTATFYIGSSSVTSSGATRGIPITGGTPFTANDDAGDYYIISSSAAQTVFILEQE